MAPTSRAAYRSASHFNFSRPSTKSSTERSSAGHHGGRTGQHEGRRVPGPTGTNEHGAARGGTDITCLLIRRAGFETLAAHSVDSSRLLLCYVATSLIG